MACLKFCGTFLVIFDCSCHYPFKRNFMVSCCVWVVSITTMASCDKKRDIIKTVLAFDCLFVLSIHLMTVCVFVCVSVQHIAVYSSVQPRLWGLRWSSSGAACQSRTCHSAGQSEWLGVRGLFPEFTKIYHFISVLSAFIVIVSRLWLVLGSCWFFIQPHW